MSMSIYKDRSLENSFGQTPMEEFANSITHGLGVVLAFIASYFLLNKSMSENIEYKTLSYCIYITCAIFLYSSSTIYHFSTEGSLKRKFHAMDQIGIYLFIAGQYMPFTLVNFRENIGIALSTVVWMTAVFGIVVRILPIKVHDYISATVYILMGGTIVFTYKYALAEISQEGIIYILLGGVAYFTGLIFYFNHKINFAHTIWHLFVLLGSYFHFLAIYNCII